jgi:N,N'-diacetyllegionaminate synthase
MYIIAEAGVNHNGQLDLALRYCKGRIDFLSTPFDLDSIEFLKNLGLKTFKVGSSEIDNLPYLIRFGSLKATVILSTGMSCLEEVRSTIDCIMEGGTRKENIILLHCTSLYPTPMEDVNLKAMVTMKREFGMKVGYSDHTAGIEVPIAATALGATIIEKHLTLDKTMEGPDHKSSIEPDEFKAMVKAINNIEKSLGNGEKPTLKEWENKRYLRKSIAAAKPIKKGEVFTDNNLTTLRPGTGRNPMKWDKWLGRTSIINYKKGELI